MTIDNKDIGKQNARALAEKDERYVWHALSRYTPTKYALTWDPDMPFDVPIDSLDAAIETALASADRPEVAARSAELSRRAHEHLTDLADRVMTLATTETARDRARRLERRRAQQVGEPAEWAA